MTISKLDVEVSARLTVPDEVADQCLALLEWWQKEHAEQVLMAETKDDGSIHLYRELRHDPSTGG